MSTYRVVPAPLYSRSRLALASRYARIEDAVANTGEGVVVADDGRLVAFHERHLPMIERLAAVSAP